MRSRLTVFLTPIVLLSFGAVDLSAQVVEDLLGYWSGRVRLRTEVEFDPALSRAQRDRYPDVREDQFWIIDFRDTGGRMQGWQRYVDWNQQDRIESGDMYGYPLEVTEVDLEGRNFTVEWGQGADFRCEADLELLTDERKLEGRFVCRRRENRIPDIIQRVTRGRLEFEPHRRDRGGSGGVLP